MIEVISPVVYRVRIDGREKIIHANRMKRDPRRRPLLVLSASILDDFPSVPGHHYYMEDPHYATSQHLQEHSILPLEMMHLAAHTITTEGTPLMLNPFPPEPPRIRRSQYPDQASFNTALRLRREDYKRTIASHQLHLDLLHKADVTATTPTLSVHSGHVSLCTQPLL